MISPSVSAVIVSYNTADLIVDAIESLLDQDCPPVEVIVVDNASSDGSVEQLRHRYANRSDVRVLSSPGNVGFARAANIGAQAGRCNLLLFFNPDARLEAGGLRHLVEAWERDRSAGLYGPTVLFPDGRVNRTTARPLPTPWSLTCHALLLSFLRPNSTLFNPDALHGWDRTTERTVGMLSGVCLLVDREIWRRLAGFDERYWLYGEDADLSHRARELGAAPRAVPASLVTHAPGSSSSDTATKLGWMRQGEVTYLRQHWSGLQLRFGLTMVWLGSALRAAHHRFARRTNDVDWQSLFADRHRWLRGFGPGPHDGPPR